MSNWVETIERADHKGDTKEIPGVKALIGIKRSMGKHPTIHEDIRASCASQRTVKFKPERIRASDAKVVTSNRCVCIGNVDTRVDATANTGKASGKPVRNGYSSDRRNKN